ncbi:MAG TPA: YdcF family protein [Pseudonocardia sp.]|nr:YdcF family protein [Pseudonocardia sp.]
MSAISSEATTVALRHPAGPRPRRVGVLGWVYRLLLGGLVLALLVVGGTAFRVWQVARVDDRQPVDAVVVLGAAQYDGDPSRIFESRLRHAETLFERGVAPRIVTTGGGRPGDVYTEAEAGRRFLVERGVPADAVIAVPEGSDTLSSLQAVAVRAGQDGWTSAVMVSDPWHSLRARIMAHDAGLTASTSPTRSGPVVQTRETQARYIVRETAATLFYRLTHASVDASVGADAADVG